MKKNLVTAAATAGLLLTAFGASASAQENTYTVQSGDTLSKIAKSTNVSITSLKAWNNLTSDRIYVNQKLSINYTVQSGDSLWAIAKSQGTSVSELKSANGLTTDLIRIGQQLNIPVSNVSAASASVSSNHVGTASASVSSNHVGTSSASVSSNNNVPTTYVVQKGDSLSTIGARYHLTVSELKSMNQLTSNKIIIGRILELREARAAANQAAASATETKSQTVEQSAIPASSQASAPANTQATVNQAASTNSQQSVSPAAPAASQTNVQTVIGEAKKYIGTRYQWGGTSPSGFDCSGFVQYVFAKVGVSLPRTTSTQWGITTPVNSPSVGDLVFFETYQPGPSHVGIYLGNNQFISATDSGVKISNMTSSYWGPKYLGARKAF